MGQTTFSGPVASAKGFIAGSFTTAERDALTNVAVGTLVFNTTDNAAQVYNGSTWQAAFGPVVPPGPAYPVTLTWQASNTFYDVALTWNDTGTMLYRAGGTSIYAVPVSTPWDSTTANIGAQTSFPVGMFFPPSLSNISSGVAWNATGTELSFIANSGGSNYTQATATLALPYNINSISGVTFAPSATYLMSGSSVTFGDNGNVAYVMGGGQVHVFPLPSPYNWVGSSSMAAVDYPLASNLGLYNYPQQIVFSPDGTIGIVVQSGPSYTGQITQFQLGTAWDITTVNTGTAITTDVSPSLGYVGFGGTAVKPDFTKLYLTGGMMTQYIYEYSIT